MGYLESIDDKNISKNFRIPLKYKKIHLKLNFSFKY